MTRLMMLLSLLATVAACNPSDEPDVDAGDDVSCDDLDAGPQPDASDEPDAALECWEAVTELRIVECKALCDPERGAMMCDGVERWRCEVECERAPYCEFVEFTSYCPTGL